MLVLKLKLNETREFNAREGTTFQKSTKQIDRLIIEILITHAHAIHIIVLISVLIKLIVQIVLETLIDIITKQIARFNNQ